MVVEVAVTEFPAVSSPLSFIKLKEEGGASSVMFEAFADFVKSVDECVKHKSGLYAMQIKA